MDLSGLETGRGIAVTDARLIHMKKGCAAGRTPHGGRRRTFLVSDLVRDGETRDDRRAVDRRPPTRQAFAVCSDQK